MQLGSRVRFNTFLPSTNFNKLHQREGGRWRKERKEKERRGEIEGRKREVEEGKGGRDGMKGEREGNTRDKEKERKL